MLKHMSFENFDPRGRAVDAQGRETLQAAVMFAQAFAKHPEGWLVLVGDSGCGKTHLAVAVGNERLQRGEEVFFAFVPDLLDHLRYTFSPDSRVTYDELFDRVKQTPLLVLDDLGSETSTAWANEKLYQVIVHRHNARLPTIITTRAIATGQHDPIASRLSDSRLVTVMPITAPDYRQQGRARRGSTERGSK
jgi:DNA replication protein DnaC